MARRHAVKAEEVRIVFAGVVGPGRGESVGKRADVEAWRSLEPLEEEAHRHKATSPHAIRKETRAACPSRASAHPYLTLQPWPSNGRGPGVWDCCGPVGVCKCRLDSLAPQRGDLVEGCAVDIMCSYSGHSQSQSRSCGARPLQRASFDSWLYLCSLRCDVGMCVPSEMADVGGKTATRIVSLEG